MFADVTRLFLAVCEPCCQTRTTGQLMVETSCGGDTEHTNLGEYTGLFQSIYTDETKVDHLQLVHCRFDKCLWRILLIGEGRG